MWESWNYIYFTDKGNTSAASKTYQAIQNLRELRKQYFPSFSLKTLCISVANNVCRTVYLYLVIFNNVCESFVKLLYIKYKMENIYFHKICWLNKLVNLYHFRF